VEQPAEVQLLSGVELVIQGEHWLLKQAVVAVILLSRSTCGELMLHLLLHLSYGVLKRIRVVVCVRQTWSSELVALPVAVLSVEQYVNSHCSR